MTRSAPPCCVTNKRPSGANAIAVAFERPDTTCVSVNPEGSVAADALTASNTAARLSLMASAPWSETTSRRYEEMLYAGPTLGEVDPPVRNMLNECWELHAARPKCKG